MQKFENISPNTLSVSTKPNIPSKLIIIPLNSFAINSNSISSSDINSFTLLI